MNITVIHGSPRLKYSGTAVFIDFFKKNFPDVNFQVYSVGKDINRIREDPALFNTIMKSIESADAVFWILPVYYTLVPAQLKEFIELVYEKKAASFFKDTYTAVMTTSIHFFDHTTINYMHAVCEDLGMKYVDGFSSYAYPRFNDAYKQNILTFFSGFLKAVQTKRNVTKEYSELSDTVYEYKPGLVTEEEKKENYTLCLITDAGEKDTSLNNMIDTFIKKAACKVDVINLNDVKMTGCISCLKCGAKSICGIKDDFMDFFEKRIKTADGIMYAGSIKDRFLSSRFKMFFDRSFYNNHIPFFKGKQIAAIISGNLKEHSNLKQALEGIIQLNGGNKIGFVSDEYSAPEHTTSLLHQLSEDMIGAIKSGYSKPKNFLGVGTDLLFRDFIYLVRYPFIADYKEYKKAAFKTFPQKRKMFLLKRSFLFLLAKLNPKNFLEDYFSKANSMMRKLLEVEEDRQ